jgi:hypothetical protein
MAHSSEELASRVLFEKMSMFGEVSGYRLAVTQGLLGAVSVSCVSRPSAQKPPMGDAVRRTHKAS